MKRTILTMLSMATVAGLAGIATATPLGLKELKDNQGSIVSEVAKDKGALGSENHGYYVSQTANGSQNGTYVQNSVPVSGSTLILFGAGFVALAILHRRYRGGWAA